MGEHAVVAPFLGTDSFAIAEVGAALILLIIAFAAPLPDWALPKKIGVLAADLARRPRLCVLMFGTLAPLIRISLLPLIPIPQPYFHDEFSHLLAADTFASGRLSNPTHPMWVHFESFHINHQPTYMSMEFPAQGLVLALGKACFGNPWYGVCISVGLMCGAIYWMLQGWLPAGWALLGGFLVVLRLGVLSYWMNSYWGGAVSATGGALLLGALPRLTRQPRSKTALLLGLGVALLANSRPYEGVLLCMAVAVALLRWVAGPNRPPAAVLVKQVVLPIATLLMLTAGAMAYYNWRVYGSPTTLPYRINRATYAVSPYFLWQTPRPEPAYRHKIMRDFYIGLELDVFQRARTVGGFLEGVVRRLVTIPYFFFGATLSIPLLMLRRLFHDLRARFLMAAAAASFLGLLAVPFMQPHYLAPATGLYYAILLLSMEHLQLYRLGAQRTGAFLVTVIPCLCVVLFGVQLVFLALSPKTDLPRTRVQHTLERLPGRQLAIVRYVPDHDSMDDWVYNAADIDSAKVVWAREMGGPADRELMDYFKDREAWLVEPDQRPPKVTPYAR